MSKKMSKKYQDWLKRKLQADMKELTFQKKFGPIIISSSVPSLTRLSSLSKLKDYKLAFDRFCVRPLTSIPPSLSSLPARGLQIPKPYRSFRVRSNMYLERLGLSEPDVRRRIASIMKASPSHYNYFRYPWNNKIEGDSYVGPLFGPHNYHPKPLSSKISSWYGAEYGLLFDDLSSSPSTGSSSENLVLDHTWFKFDIMATWMKRLETDFGYTEFVSQASNPWMRPDRLVSYFTRKSFDPLGSFECTDLYDQILTQYNGHTANVGMTLGEGKETIDYLKSRVSSLVDLVKNIKSKKALFSPEKLKKLRAKHVIDGLTDAQLEYQYAILPLMSDIENYISLYHRKILPKCTAFKKYTSSYNIVIPSKSNTTFHTIYGANPLAPCSPQEWASFASQPPAIVTACYHGHPLGLPLVTQNNVDDFLKFDHLDSYEEWGPTEESYNWEGLGILPNITFSASIPSPVVNLHCEEVLKKSLTFYPEKPLELSSSLGLSGKDLPSLAWDLTSLSFVVNWFVNIDEVISGFSNKVEDLRGSWVESFHLERTYSVDGDDSAQAIRVVNSDRHVQDHCSIQGQYTLAIPESWSQFVSLFSLAWKMIT